MTRTYDAIVVGLGAMGAAATYQLAKAGANVLGIDRHDPPHDRGSSHGDSRITRLAIGEGAHFVPLVKRSHELWREIERETGATILTETGMLLIGAREAAVLHGAADFLATTIAAAEEHGIEHERLTAADVARRFPQFALGGDERGAYYEPTGGFVRPETAITAQLKLARGHGAQTRTNERVRTVEGGRVTTDAGTYAARHVILAAGPWVNEFVPAGRFTVHRQVLYWFESDTPQEHEDMPIFIWELGTGPDDFFYGFPAVDGAVKLSTEEYERATTPDACDRDVREDEWRRFHERFVKGRLRGVGERCVRATTCLYTVTDDRDFVIEEHDEGVLLVSACSGHGFKHSAAIGEQVARRLAAAG
ncbi:MAG: N-methyl-L-tryptophan oxidase [Actinomycetota bacterium]|nr:N-methyl-L-tryptophan oxidase [Actinomycetota bacterium]